MLVLNRKVDQRILIGDDIIIQVTRIRGRYVSLGITAPTGVRILREEIKNDAPSEIPESECPPSMETES